MRRKCSLAGTIGIHYITKGYPNTTRRDKRRLVQKPCRKRELLWKQGKCMRQGLRERTESFCDYPEKL